jgi:hypothetical protein
LKLSVIVVADSIGKIRGYRYKKAEEAFHRHETTDFHLDCSGAGATVRMTGTSRARW